MAKTCSFILTLIFCFSSLKSIEQKNNCLESQEETIRKLFTKKKHVTLVDQETIEKLDIFSLQESSLFSSINRTQTIFGKIICQQILTEPSIDRALIFSRQEIIEELSTNKILLHQLSLHLDKIKKTEKALIHYFQDKTDIEKEIDSYYFTNMFRLESYNTSPLALEISRRFEQARLLSSVALIPIIGLIMKSFSNQYIYNMQVAADNKKLFPEETISPQNSNWKEIMHDAYKIIPKSINPFPTIFKNGYDKTITINNSELTLGDTIIEQSYKNGIWIPLLYGKSYAGLLFNGLILGIMIESIPKTIFEKNSKIALLQKTLFDISCFIKAHDALLALIQENKVIRKLILQENPIDQKLEQLKELLSTATIQEPSDRFMHGGRILVAHKLIQEIKELLVPSMKIIGEIDSYVGIAKLIKEHEILPVKYCIASFVNSSSPVINFTDFWHPITPKEKAVTNTILLGGENNPYGAIITGPHGCGKSTAMKAITLNLILAQTFGIVAAKQAQLSMFTKINTYLNIQDNINLGWSTFVAEQARVDIILDSVRHLKPYEFSFNMLDEVFKGTIEKEGAQRTFDCGKELASYKNSLSMIAVHSELPTELEEYTNGTYKNFHVELTENNNGQFVKTFKLIQGKNNWWFNDNLKRKRFISYLQKTILGTHIIQHIKT